MAKPDIPQPRSSEFKLSSEWSYAMSVWYQDTGRLKLAQLYATRARYHQELEFAELARARFAPVKVVPEVKPRATPATDYMILTTRAKTMARVMYMRSRHRHPLKKEVPSWDELTEAQKELYIEDAMEAIRSTEERA